MNRKNCFFTILLFNKIIHLLVNFKIDGACNDGSYVYISTKSILLKNLINITFLNWEKSNTGNVEKVFKIT